MQKNKKYIGIDLGGWYGDKTRIAVLEKIEGGIALIELYEPPKISQNDFETLDKELYTYIQSHQPVLIAIDAPFSIPSYLCSKKREKFYTNKEYEKEITNPYIYDNSARFVYEKTGLKPLAPAGDTIGRLTARMQHFMEIFKEIYFVKKPNLEITVKNKLVAIEVYPAATLFFINHSKKISAYKNNWQDKKKDMLNLIKPFFSDFETISLNIKTDDDYDALICALSAYLIDRNGYIAPLPTELEKFTNSFIFMPNISQ